MKSWNYNYGTIKTKMKTANWSKLCLFQLRNQQSFFCKIEFECPPLVLAVLTEPTHDGSEPSRGFLTYPAARLIILLSSVSVDDAVFLVHLDDFSFLIQVVTQSNALEHDASPSLLSF
mmetsp:Transcript_18180/g.34731  ORF Transcript_18180/g.34731 Transcript_18180/m.34731 type:complete len:118 (-) Transcript_18180:785-1138(-)